MKRIAKITLLIVFIYPTLGFAQDAGQAPSPPSDKQAQKRAERERKKKDEAAEKEAAQRLPDQLGVRCSRLKGKHKQ